MDLVTDDDDVVLKTGVQKPPQLLGAPDASHGVMGAAEDEHLGVGVCGLRLEIVEVHLVAVCAVLRLDDLERVLDEPASVFLDREPEGAIDWWLDDDAVSRLGERPYGVEDGGHDPCRGHEGTSLGKPAVSALLPGEAGVVVRLGGGGIAKGRLLKEVPQGLDHLGRISKLHVRDGEGHDLRSESRVVIEHLAPLRRARPIR